MSTPGEIHPNLSEIPAPNLVFIGGGGGASTVAAAAAEHWTGANLTAIISTSDSGGSTGRLRDQFGTPPVGDLRKVTSALAANTELAARFEYRFGGDDDISTVQSYGRELLIHLLDRPDLEAPDWRHAAWTVERTVSLAQELDTVRGHAFGNLIMTAIALEDSQPNVTKAAATVGKWLQARGRVLPVTTTRHDLVMLDGNEVIIGEHEIDERHVQNPRDAIISLEPHAPGQLINVTPEARDALANADMTVVGPGSVFTSVLPVIAVEGVTDAMAESQERGGTLVAIGNLVTSRDTVRMPFVTQIVRKVDDSLGEKSNIAHVLYNTDMKILPAETALPYAPDGSETLSWDAHGHELVKHEEVVIDPNDVLAATRSAAHHDAEAVVSAMQGIWAVHTADRRVTAGVH